ncbi:MAG: hypothetical protein MUC40_05145 [Akkermansiaceae bacterium]|nr:hypothetical protein [Akkermansiaceae bacterium]
MTTWPSHAGAHALGGITPDAGAAPQIEQALGADAGGVDADHGRHHGFGEVGIFVVEAREQFDVAEAERRSFRQGEGFRAEPSVLFVEAGNQIAQAAARAAGAQDGNRRKRGEKNHGERQQPAERSIHG